MREHNQLRLALGVIEEYDFKLPLSNYLGEFYKRNRQMGARDRRQFSHALYSYYRLGNALKAHPEEERLAIALFLCSTGPDKLADFLCREYTSLPAYDPELPLSEKLKITGSAYPDFSSGDIFPLIHLLSPALVPEKEIFLTSLLRQPYVWIRIRKVFTGQVLQELGEKGLAYITDTSLPDCYGFVNTTPLSSLETFAKGYFEIQDRSSQQTIEYIEPTPGSSLWDCCAASGGKSLMVLDKYPGIYLTVSDIRPSILSNLQERFKRVGIKNYNPVRVDLTNPSQLSYIRRKFDTIIADVPCSGSGTWGRTPEMLRGFEEQELSAFTERQKKIVSAIADFLEPGGQLIYITCSIFRSENEEIIDYIAAGKKLRPVLQQVLKGYDRGADTMFIAKLIKE